MNRLEELRAKPDDHLKMDEMHSDMFSTRQNYSVIPVKLLPQYPIPDNPLLTIDNDNAMECVLEYAERLRNLPSNLLTRSDSLNTLTPLDVIPCKQGFPNCDYCNCNTINWHEYTGGVLDTTHVLFSTFYMAVADAMNNVALLEIHMTDNKWNIKNHAVMELSSGGIIFQVVMHQNEATGEIYVAVRQRYCITVARQGSEENDLKLMKKYETETPLISLSFVEGEEPNVVAVDLDGIVTFYKLEAKDVTQVQLTHRTQSFDDFWKILPLNYQSYLIADRSTIYTYDQRAKSTTIHFQYTGQDYVSDMCSSRSQPSGFYLGTYRKVYRMDLRKVGYLTKWSHYMYCAPITMDAVAFNNAEYVCVASHKTDEKMVMGEEFANTIYFPRKVPGIHETIRTMMSMNIVDHCKRMFERSNIRCVGAKFVKAEDRFHLASSNGLGDVFMSDFSTVAVAEACGPLYTSAVDAWHKALVALERRKRETLLERTLNVQADSELVASSTWCASHSGCNKRKRSSVHTKAGAPDGDADANELCHNLLSQMCLEEHATARDLSALWFPENAANPLDAIPSDEETTPHNKVTKWLNENVPEK